MDAEKICRLCGYDLYKPIHIYATPGLSDQISRNTELRIGQGDGFPSCICELCDKKLQIADNFRQDVQKADELMRNYFGQDSVKPTEPRRSAFVGVKFENNVTEWLAGGDHHPGVRSQPRNHRIRIRRERIRLSERRPRYSRIFLRDKYSKRSLAYSYRTARSLVASYKALINRCGPGSYLEEFAVPSSLQSFDNESDSGDEGDVGFAAARCRPLEEIVADDKTPGEITRTAADYGLSVQPVLDGNTSPLFQPRFQPDPLNLLKVKRIRPLHDDDNDSNSTAKNLDFHFDSDSSASWRCDDRVGPSGRLGGMKEVDDQTSDSSDIYSSEEEAQILSSTSSGDSVRIIKQQLGKPAAHLLGLIRNNDVEQGHENGDVSEPRISDSQCPVCSRVCVNAFGLGVHMRTHMSTKCQICSAPTPTKEKFKEHMQLHVTSSASPLVQCGICKNIFKNKMALSVHMRVHSMSVPAAKECPHCKKIFATYRGFKIHLAKSHSGFVTE